MICLPPKNIMTSKSTSAWPSARKLSNPPRNLSPLSASLLLAFFVILLIALLPNFSAGAQTAVAGRVQAVSGSIETGEVDIYRLGGLKGGQIISANMQAESGDLDPLLGAGSGRQR